MPQFRIDVVVDSGNATASIKKVSNELGNVDKAANQTQNSMGRVTTLLKGAAAAYLGFATVLAGGRAIINANREMERFNNSLRVGLGSQKAATEAMGFLRQESERLGLNLPVVASQFSKLAAAARGTALEGQATRDIFTAIAEASTVLGLSAEQTGGALTAIEQIISKGTVSAEELRGQLGERLPGAFQIAARAMGVTTQELDKMLRNGELLAEDLLPNLARELNNTFGDEAEQAAGNLNAQINRMQTALFELAVAVGNTGIVDLFSDALQAATGFVNFITGAVAPAIGQLSEAEKQLQKIARLEDEVKELSGTGSFFGFVKNALVDNTQELHAAEQALEDAKIDYDNLTKAAEQLESAVVPLAKPLRDVAVESDKSATSTKKMADEGRKLVQSLIEEQATIGKTATEMKEWEAARAGVLDTARPLILAIEQENEALRKQEQIMSDVAQVTEKYQSAEQKLATELKRLDTLLANGLGWQEYQAAVADARDEILEVPKELEKVQTASKSIFDDVEQFGIQAARNIQTAFADFLFNPFEEGLKGLFRSFSDVLRRMVAEIASSGILRGISSIFSGGTFASGFGSTFGGLANLGGFFGLNKNAQFNNLGGAGTAFIGGPGTALGGTGTNGLSSALPSLGTVLSTAALGLLGTSIGSAIAGDKQVFGANGTVVSGISAGLGAAVGSFFGAPGIGAGLGGILGGAINGIFGRGPLEQQDSLIRGTVGSGGINDDFLTATNFRAEGGLLRGDKVDRVIINANTGELINGAPGLPESGISGSLGGFAEQASQQAVQIGQVFDTAIGQFNTSLRSSADTLGITTRGLDQFKAFLQLTSAAGESITEQQVAEALSEVGDKMAKVLIPNIAELSKENETAFQTVNRLAKETASLQTALEVLGVSSADAEKAIMGLSLAARSDLVDAAGGLEAFNQQIGFFASTFLTAEEQLELSFNALDEEMHKLGFSAAMSRERFAELIKSVTEVGGVSTETAAALLRLAPAFDSVKSAEERLAASRQQAASGTGSLASSEQQLGSQAQVAASSVNSLSSSVGGLGASAADVASAVQASFNRIDTARANLEAAENQLAVSRAQRDLSSAQNELNAANNAVSIAQQNLAAAQSAEQRAQQQSNQAQQTAINDNFNQLNENFNRTISERQELINLYQQEASSLRSVADRFSAFADRIFDFRDSLALGDLSPFSPSEQLAIARQQVDDLSARANAGDEDALNKLPSAVESLLRASLQANGATEDFRQDFLRGQDVLQQAGEIARQTGNTASQQLVALESSIEQLELLNEQTRIAQEQAREDARIAQEEARAQNDRTNSSLGSIDSSVMSVDAAMAQLEAAQSRAASAQAQVNMATRDVEAALFTQNGFIDDVGMATIQVRDAVRELAAAVLQGFGNAFISDKQIVDFVLANQNMTDQQFAQAAVDAGVSGDQLKRALAPLGVSSERINTATGGLAVSDQVISDTVNQLLAAGDFMGIYNLAIANGISSQRLANASVLSKAEIDAFVQANGLAPFAKGTDFIPRDGIAMLHKGEAVVPSTAISEIVVMRQELADLLADLTQQMSVLISSNIKVNEKTAMSIITSNERMAANEDWRQRSRARFR